MNTVAEKQKQNQQKQEQNQNQSQTQSQTPQTSSQQDGRSFIIPPANISAKDNEYVVELEMPGVTKDGLEVMVEGNELTIIGRRAAQPEAGEIVYRESLDANYRRMFELGPDVDTTKISAQMQQGVLLLHLPKSEKAKPKQIEVKVS